MRPFLSFVLVAGLSAATPLWAGTLAISSASVRSNALAGFPIPLFVSISSVPSLYAFQFDVLFDPGVLSSGTPTAGSDFSSAGGFFVPGEPDSITGVIRGTAGTLLGPSSLPSGGQAALAVLPFFTRFPTGHTTVTLSNVLLLDAELRELPVDFVIGTVQWTFAPEPSLVPPVLVLAAFLQGRAWRNERRA